MEEAYAYNKALQKNALRWSLSEEDKKEYNRSAKLFTDLDKIEEGDRFMLQVLDETLTYKVDQIRIVLPTEIDNLQIEDSEDYCTLITCTPYGINSHRILVRGHRVKNIEEAKTIYIVSEASQVEPKIVAVIIAISLLLLIWIWFGRENKR